jgi:hypothetical protein
VLENSVKYDTKTLIDSSSSPKLSGRGALLLRNFVPAKIGLISSDVLIDSGADICLANVNVLLKFPHVQVYPSEISHAFTASNECMSVQGVICLHGEMCGHRVSYKFYIVPRLHTNFIIGRTFLEKYGAVIDFGKRKLHLTPRRSLVATEPVTIPPNSEKLIVARVKGDPLPEGVTGVCSGNDTLSTQGLLSGNVLCHVNRGHVYQRIANFSDSPVTVCKGSRTGKFNCINGSYCVYDLESTETDRPRCSHVCATAADRKVNTNLKGPSPQVQIAPELTADQRHELKCLLDQYADVFVGEDGKLGHCDIIKHEIQLQEGHKPVRQRSYRLSPAHKPIMEEMIEDMKSQGIIEESTSPWSAPAMLIAKRGKNTDGNSKNSFRFVVDFRRLNASTIADAHPLPTTQEALESIGSSNPAWFSGLDMQCGFHQIIMDESSKQYTSFSSPFGLHQYNRLAQGLRNSPSTFQRVMESVLRGLNWKTLLIYIDNIIVYSKTWDLHLKHLEEVFLRFRKANLKLHPRKCHFAKKEIEYLGHLVSEDGIKPNPDKVSAVSSYPPPKDVKDLRAFLGLSGYYRRFIKDYSKIAAPLFHLTKRDEPFVWSPECQAAFEQLKINLTSAPILGYPHFGKPFRLYSDSSNFSIGAVLCQVQQGVERVIAYAGRSLSPAERNYGITEKECLALVFATKHFDCYLRSSEFEAIVDHSALTWLCSVKAPTGRLARWITWLQGYNVKVIYRKGRDHGNADAISRRPYDTGTDCGDDPYEAPKIVDSSPEDILHTSFLEHCNRPTRRMNKGPCQKSSTSRKHSHQEDRNHQTNMPPPYRQIFQHQMTKF